MDPNKIFKIFSSNGIEIDYLEGKDEDWMNTPKYKVGMFTKLINNGLYFNKTMINLFTKGEDETQEVEDAAEFIMYNRAYYWVSGFIVDDSEWVEALNFYERSEVEVALDSTVKYFEGIEEYEKCSFLTKIKSYLKEG